jgi:hypothetical protein
LDLSIADFNQKRLNGTAQAQINNNRSAQKNLYLEEF